MAVIRLPSGTVGSKKVFPYLARVSKEYTDFTSFILLIEKNKQTILFGNYTGPHENVARRYSIGNTFEGGFRIGVGNLVPFNEER